MVISLGLGATGILQELSRSGVTMPAVLLETSVPSWGWYLASVLGLLGGSFGAFHKLRVERDALKDERRVVEAKISTSAFSLRRQIRSWLGIEPHRAKGVSGAADLADHYKNLPKGEIDIAESRMEEIAKLGAQVGDHISEQVSSASLLFLSATRKLNTHAATPQPAGKKEWDWIRLIQDAEKDLEECLTALEEGPINQSRLREEVELEKRRKREHDPFDQLAEKLLPGEDEDD